MTDGSSFAGTVSLENNYSPHSLMNNVDDFINNSVRLKNYINVDNSISYQHVDGIPNFSVIIPCYNTGETIERTVISILIQTLDNIEIVVVNDASTDEQTIDKLSELEQYINVINLENNTGLSNARNVGINNSRAEYILCLDSDDFIAPTYLEKAKIFFDRDSTVGVVGTGIHNFGGSEGTWRQPEDFKLEELLATNKVLVASCVRRSVYNDTDLYDVNLRSYEDWEFWIRVFSSEKKWKNRVIQENLFYYYVHSDSMQHSMDNNAMNEVLDIIFDKHEKLYKKHFKSIFQNIHIQYTNNRLTNKKLAYDVEQRDKRIDRLLKSKSIRIGELFRNSIKYPHRLILSPYYLIKILLEK